MDNSVIKATLDKDTGQGQTKQLEIEHNTQNEEDEQHGPHLISDDLLYFCC